MCVCVSARVSLNKFCFWFFVIFFSKKIFYLLIKMF